VDVAFELEYKGEKRPATLVDTAGLRKRSKVDTLVERFSVMRAESAVKRADLVLFVVEAKPEGLTAQDRRIAGMISESGKGCIIVANKWDICEGHKQKHVLNEIRYTLPRMDYAPVVFTCALSGLNVGLLLDTIAEVMGQMEVQVPTSMVNRVIEDATTRNSPPIVGKQPFKIFYGTMVKNVPPTFVLFVNNPDLCAPNYMGYLNNCFRRNFDLLGLPIRIEFRARPKREFVPSASSSKPKKRVSQARLANRKYKSKKRR
jgi:GTP-binding protein